jgi:hypothetical protein
MDILSSVYMEVVIFFLLTYFLTIAGSPHGRHELSRVLLLLIIFLYFIWSWSPDSAVAAGRQRYRDVHHQLLPASQHHPVPDGRPYRDAEGMGEHLKA